MAVVLAPFSRWGVSLVACLADVEAEMRKLMTALVAASMLATVPGAALADGKDGRKEWRKERKEARKEWRRDAREGRRAWREARRDDWRTYRTYDYNRFDPRYGNYYADRYYRDGSYYQPRYLAYNDRIYRGRDGRYYCRRPDGTTGLIIGALAGGVLGNVIAPGDSKTLGTVIGAVGGGLAGRAIDRDRVSCR
jgi:Ni/Co efflux regulator RcnB